MTKSIVIEGWLMLVRTVLFVFEITSAKDGPWGSLWG